MSDTMTIGIDLSKRFMQLCVVARDGEILEERCVLRDRLEAAVAGYEGALVAMEACGGAHHWGRRFQRSGHAVKLLPPKAVKAFCDQAVKDDKRDARAVAEAGRLRYVRPVAVKTEEAQALQALDRVEALHARQHTQLGNALRGLLAEFGLVLPKGPHQLKRRFAELMARAGDAGIPEVLRPALEDLYCQFLRAGEALAQAKKRIRAAARAEPQARLLMSAPGIGPQLASATLALVGEPERFPDARHFASWTGLTPRLYRSAETCRLGRISKRGNKRLRSLFVMGAQSLLQRCKQGYYKGDTLAEWARRLLRHKPWNLAVCALASKLARIAWRLLMSQRPYRAQKA